jgi:hypothetical protein
MPRLAALPALVVAAVLLAGCAVTPTVQWQRSTFDGFDVISYVPDNPRGIVFAFHGTNGSAAIVDRVEPTDVLNRLIARGYGFVSTSSTERTGDQRWQVTDPSPANPDLARLVRLRDHLIATTPVTTTTPLVGIGMSNGARFVTLWGQAWRNAGYPVKAIWASHGRTAPPFDGAGQLTVPTVFSTSENDFTVPPGQVIQSFLVANRAGTPSELYVSRERRLNSAQFERIPGIDAEEARQVLFSLTATGVWNGQGERVEPDPERAAARAAGARLPAWVTPSQGREIANETGLLLGVHQFTAEYAEQVAAFFARYVP